jgi:hypothetical protein
MKALCPKKPLFDNIAITIVAPFTPLGKTVSLKFEGGG